MDAHNLASRPSCAMAPSAHLERDSMGKPIIRLDSESVYTFGHLIRLTESLLLKLFGQGLLSGTTHTALGQELCQMAVVRALNDPNDVIVSNHRNHGHFLTYSGDFLGLIAEIMGREAGVCNGRGGSQHIAYRNFHSNGVQAGMMAIAVGHAMAAKLRGRTSVVAAMIGDGTLGQGLVYESMNMASIWALPLLFVVEHNGIAQTTPTAWTMGGCIMKRGEAFGLQTWRFDDAQPDFLERVEHAVDWVRTERRPGFLVIDTKRKGPHSKGDDLRGVLEMDAIGSRDPLQHLGAGLDDLIRADIERRNEEFLDAVLDQAKRSPEARLSQTPGSIFNGHGRSARFAPAPPVLPSPERVCEPVTVRSSLNQALHDLLSQSRQVLLLGEDLHDPYGGAFKVSSGLSTSFGERVISTPISEAALVGSGIGLALEGFRPIVEIMFADFVSLGIDQLYNHAVKFPGLFDHARVPLVVRTPSGGRRGYGSTHSQSPENLLTSVPGLTVVFGSHRHDCGQLLKNTVTSWPYPTVFLEHKLLYGMKQERGGYRELPADPRDEAALLFPTLSNSCDAPDITFLTFGGMLPVVEEAARELAEEEELRCEIVVPALLAPLPRQTLLKSLLPKPRIVAVEESHAGFGVSAEFGAVLLEAGYRGKFLRLGTPPVPIPAARSLEAQVIPGKREITAAVLSLF